MSTTQPIRSYEDVQRLKNYYYEKGVYRDFLLVSVCLNTALRICDVLSLKWKDVMDINTGKIKEHIRVEEAKTEKITIIKLNSSVKSALDIFIKSGEKGSEYIFTNRSGNKLSRITAFNIIRNGGRAIGLPYDISCHSLRKTFGYHAWKRGVPPAIIMQIYNHVSFDVTKRYLGITQDDKDAVYTEMVL